MKLSYNVIFVQRNCRTMKLSYNVILVYINYYSYWLWYNLIIEQSNCGAKVLLNYVTAIKWNYCAILLSQEGIIVLSGHQSFFIIMKYINRIIGNFCGVKFLRFWTKKKTFNFSGILFTFYTQYVNLWQQKVLNHWLDNGLSLER